MAGTGPSGTTATLNLMLGLFLKLLGFFVVLYGFTEVDPIKAKQAEISIQERFNINISLVPEIRGASPVNQSVVQTAGRAYEALEEDLKSQIDFLSTEYVAHNDTMILRLPADVVLPLEDRPAKSPAFADILEQVLSTQHSPNKVFDVQIVVVGENDDALIRAVSIFVQKMIAEGYPEKLLTIGYQSSDEEIQEPIVEFHVKQVPQ